MDRSITLPMKKKKKKNTEQSIHSIIPVKQTQAKGRSESHSISFISSKYSLFLSPILFLFLFHQHKETGPLFMWIYFTIFNWQQAQYKLSLKLILVKGLSSSYTFISISKFAISKKVKQNFPSYRICINLVHLSDANDASFSPLSTHLFLINLSLNFVLNKCNLDTKHVSLLCLSLTTVKYV